MPIIATRQRLPDDRKGIVHRFQVDGHKGYLRVGLYPDGAPGEIFITMSKMGSTVNGLLDSFAIVVSVALQSGVPLQALVTKLNGKAYEPSGRTANPSIAQATSITDYIFRWMEQKFIAQGGQAGLEKTALFRCWG